MQDAQKKPEVRVGMSQDPGSESSATDSQAGIIAGSVVAVIGVLFIIVLAATFVHKRRQRQMRGHAGAAYRPAIQVG
jgi:predicted permease